MGLAAEVPFTSALIDMDLPNREGFRAGRALRDQGFQGTLVGLTSRSLEGAARLGERADFTSYLAKPARLEELMRSLSELG